MWWIARIPCSDASAGYRLSICCTRSEAFDESELMLTVYEPENAPEVFEADIPQILVMIGKVDLFGERQLRKLGFLGIRYYLRFLLPYCAPLAAAKLINEMTRTAVIEQKEKHNAV